MTAVLESDSPGLEEEAFQDFFRSSEGDKYRRRLAQVATNQERSLVIDFDELVTFDPALARRVVERPDEYIDLASRAATAQLRVADPEYAARVGRIHARFRHFPEKTQLRHIGAEHLEKLVVVDGIVVRSTQVRPAVVKATYRCLKCAQTVREEEAGDLARGLGGICPHCKQKTVFGLIQSESEFRNTQEVRVQERPEDLPPGQLPRYLDVRLEDDLVDTARPGDRVALTALVHAERPAESGESHSRVFNLYLEANYVDVAGKEAEVVEITAEEEQKILDAAKDPWIHRNLVRSLAPSIHGYEDIKEAILYLLLGGVQKHLPDGIRIRGEINALLVGDPSTAKSQLLQYAARIAPRGLYTSGRGSTAAGLTAAVLREKTGGMILEAGALVLADKGIACVDEIDKMREDDRVAIHEAMEQQTVSVAKGGIVATLNARAAVLAAGNPQFGRYVPERNINENINLPVTILSRFDLIFIVRDRPDPDLDMRMSEHILALHRTQSHPEAVAFPPEFLRKYVSYAKRIVPSLTPEAVKEIQDFYLTMRSKGGGQGAIPIAPRQLEALIRLAEARTRAFLRGEVTVEEARGALRLVQVMLSDAGMDVATGIMDIDVIETGRSRSISDKVQRIIDIEKELERETGTVEETVLINTTVERLRIESAEAWRLLGILIRDGLLFRPKEGMLKRTRG